MATKIDRWTVGVGAALCVVALLACKKGAEEPEPAASAEAEPDEEALDEETLDEETLDEETLDEEDADAGDEADAAPAPQTAHPYVAPKTEEKKKNNNKKKKKKTNKKKNDSTETKSKRPPGLAR